MNRQFKNIFSARFIISVTLFTTLLLGSVACQRNNMPYAGVKADSNPPYTEVFDVNSQKK